MTRRWLIAAVLFGLLAAPADARRQPTDLERGAVAERMGVPPRCAVIWISTVNRRWASFQSSPKASCAQWASNGTTVLHRSNARWHQAFAGSDIPCPVPHVPAAIARDLKVGCPPR
jgi:hypothetical protein